MADTFVPEEDAAFASRFGLEVPLEAGTRPVEGFGCTLQKSDWKLPHAGTVYVTRTRVYFYLSNRLVGGSASFTWADVTQIVSTSSLLLMPAIRVETYEAVYFFSNFMHRANCLALMHHFWSATVAPRTFLHRKLVRGKDFESGLLTGGVQLRGRLLGREQDPSMLKERLKTSRALELAYEAQAIGAATLSELDAQGETIARQRRAIVHVHAHLDEADRLLRGMSLTGAAANSVTSRPVSVEDADAAAAASITYTTAMQVPVVDRTKKAYRRARLVFGDTELGMFEGDVEGEGDGPGELTVLSRYSGVTALTVMCKAYHLRIEFEERDPVTVATAYVEDIVLELGERKVAHIPLMLEDGANPLSHRVSFYSSSPGFGGRGGRGRGGDRAADTQDSASLLVNPKHIALAADVFMPSSDVEEAKAAKLRQQQALIDAEDRQLEEMSHVLDSLKAMATTMGTTLDRQNAELDALSHEVDAAESRLQDTTRKVIRKL